MEKNKFISIIKENQNLIYKVCFSYCSYTEDRKDLQQEILIQIWNSFSKFDGRVKVSTWIYKIALNTAISFYRNSSKHYNTHLPIDESIISFPSIESDSEQDERRAMLYHFIKGLNKMDKALILLYLDNIKYKEISEILGITETNVATKISRIKKRIKEQFSNN